VSLALEHTTQRDRMDPASPEPLYTAVTFAPVQSFILASRKLRDLYGSSLLLSHLARAIAEDAGNHAGTVISPASIHSSRGVPNVLVIRGDYRERDARAALLACWTHVLQACRNWLERTLQDSGIAPVNWEAGWGSSWKACAQHSWELFHGQGATIKVARQALAVHKLQRDWSVPNWTGESSTLSSAAAVVRPTMGLVQDPRHVDPGAAQDEARAFLKALRGELGDAFAGEHEEISLTELVKRLVTYPKIIKAVFSPANTSDADFTSDADLVEELMPERFWKLSGTDDERPESIIWFMADGDSIGQYLEDLQRNLSDEEKALQAFSSGMRNWAARLYREVPHRMSQKAMVVYAGGDDVFGALHESMPGRNDLGTEDLWKWLEEFHKLWKECGQALTVSMGLVWADTAVPQREALQHARDAEASAKARGKDRFALRLLYASGNHLEWTCPWSWLAPIRSHYRDREGRSGSQANWRHLADDLAWLRSRQAIAAAGQPARQTARVLWEAYFPDCVLPPPPLQEQAAGQPRSPRRAEPPAFRASFEQPEQGRRFDEWLLDLGRVMAAVQKWKSQTTVQQVAA